MGTFTVNNNLRKLANNFRKDNNQIKISSANTFIHEAVKSFVCIELKKRKYSFTTECIFEDSYKRADIYDLSNNVCYEIICSETEESIELKEKIYPVREIVRVYTKDFIEAKLKDMHELIKKVIL